MPTLTLDRVWLNRMSDGEAVSAFTISSRTRDYGQNGDVRTYGAGRQRSITTAGIKEVYKFSLLVLQADITALQSWVGVTVQLRTSRGQRFVGVYFAIAVSVELKDNINQYQVDMQLQSLTVADGV